MGGIYCWQRVPVGNILLAKFLMAKCYRDPFSRETVVYKTDVPIMT